MYVAYSYPLGQPALSALGAHTPLQTAELPAQYFPAVTAPSIADPYLVPVTAAHQQLPAAAATTYQPLTLAVCRKVGPVFPTTLQPYYSVLKYHSVAIYMYCQI